MQTAVCDWVVSSDCACAQVLYAPIEQIMPSQTHTSCAAPLTTWNPQFGNVSVSTTTDGHAEVAMHSVCPALVSSPHPPPTTPASA